MGQRAHGDMTRRQPSLWVDLAETLLLPAAIIYILLAARVVFDPSSDLRDFGAFYRSAIAWRNGSDLYAGSGTTFVTPNLNPPIFTVLFSPIAWFPIRDALLIWWAVNVAALGLALILISRELSLHPSRRMVLLGIAFAGTQAQLLLGQTAWVCVLLATLSWRAWRRERAVAAGLWLGALIGLKPLFLLALGVAVLRRKRSLVLTALGTISLTVLVGAVACGWASYGSWLETGGAVAWFRLFLNASVRGVVARFADDAVARPIWILASLAATGVALWRLTRGRSSPDRDLAVGFLTSLLVSPLGWVYYIPVALGPLLVTLRGLQYRWWMLVGLAGLFWPPGLAWASPEGQLARGLRNVVVGSMYAVGLFTLWWLALRERTQQPAPSDAQPGTPGVS